ncbi:MAG: type II secretion system GspH family protein [Lentisphaeraceae bacterium]|nr:type II secretion system GspH family protein [Lentisphaeraceae bacterium]
MRNKFTLIELLVVVAIIGILASMLLPSLSRARSEAKVAVCKSNLRQVGTAVNLYASGSDSFTPIFLDGTGDHPFEGNSFRKGRASASNPALFTYEYLETEDVYFCPLVVTDEVYNRAPKDNNTGVWGSYVYLYKHAPSGNDPMSSKRNGTMAGTNQITSINTKSEDVLMTDYPREIFVQWKAGVNWSYDYAHYNALMLDNSVSLVAKSYAGLNQWLWGKSTWN